MVEPASVIGVLFACAAVQELAPERSPGRCRRTCASLATKQFVRDAPEMVEKHYRFNHVLIRDAAYNGLLKRARATFHERFVDWADRVNRERGRETEFEEILGYHLEQAHRYLSELGRSTTTACELGRVRRNGSRRPGVGRSRAATCRRRRTCSGRVAAILPEDESSAWSCCPTWPRRSSISASTARPRRCSTKRPSAPSGMDHPTVRAKAKLIALAVRAAHGRARKLERRGGRETAAAMELFETTGDHGGLAQGMATTRLRARQRVPVRRDGGSVRARRRACSSCRGHEARGALRHAVRPGVGVRADTRARRDQRMRKDRRAGEQRPPGAGKHPLVPGSLEGMLGEIDARDSTTRGPHAARGSRAAEGPAASMSLQTGRVETLAGDLQAAERSSGGATTASSSSASATSARPWRACWPECSTRTASLRRSRELSPHRRPELAAADDIGTQALLHALHAKLQARQGRETRPKHSWPRP